MKSKQIIIVSIVCVALISFFVWGYSQSGKGENLAAIQDAGTSSAKGALSAPETFHDFGAISMKNGDVTKEFTVTNSTDKDVVLKTVLTSCMCTTAFIVEADGSVKGPFGMAGMGHVPPANEIIKAGESRAIRVVYDPNAHGPAGVGAIDRFVTLTDSNGGTVQLEIKALVTP